MPDGFQAEPPRWSAERPSAYDRFAEVNLRRPDGQGAGSWWLIGGIAATLVSVALIAVLLGLLMWEAAPIPPSSPPAPVVFTTVDFPVRTPGAPGPFGADAALNPEEELLKGNWTATAVIINGEAVPDEVLARVQLFLGPNRFRMVLPNAEAEGKIWVAPILTAKGMEGILFLGDTDVRAIYELDGDTLKMCLSDEYPDDFTARKGSKRVLLELRRSEQEP
jgi:uncharacterized protein (TIGR03067 family)